MYVHINYVGVLASHERSQPIYLQKKSNAEISNRRVAFSYFLSVSNDIYQKLYS